MKNKKIPLVGLWCYGWFMVLYRDFQQYSSYIEAVSFIGGGNRSNQRKHLPVAYKIFKKSQIIFSVFTSVLTNPLTIVKYLLFGIKCIWELFTIFAFNSTDICMELI